MLTQLAHAAAGILQPLHGALADPTKLDLLLASAGWIPEGPISQAAVDALDDALGIGDDLDTLVQLGDGQISLTEALDAIAAAGRVLRLLSELAGGDPATWEDALADAVAGLPAPFFDTEGVLAAIADVGAFLVSNWIGTALPVVRAALRFAGVLTGSIPERLDWSRLVELVSDPLARFSAAYEWGAPLSLTSVDAAARAIGDLATGPLKVTDIDPVIANRYWGQGVRPPDGVRQYGLPIIDVAATDSTELTADVALVVVPVPEGPDADPAPTGLLLAPVARAGAAVPISFGDTWSAVVTAGADLTGTEGLTIRPSAGGGVVVARESGAPDLDLAVTFFSGPEMSWTLGDPDGTRPRRQRTRGRGRDRRARRATRAVPRSQPDRAHGHHARPAGARWVPALPPRRRAATRRRRRPRHLDERRAHRRRPRVVVQRPAEQAVGPLVPRPARPRSRRRHRLGAGHRTGDRPARARPDPHRGRWTGRRAHIAGGARWRRHARRARRRARPAGADPARRQRRVRRRQRRRVHRLSTRRPGATPARCRSTCSASGSTPSPSSTPSSPATPTAGRCSPASPPRSRRHPARLRVHALRRRRAARAQPHDGRRGAGRRPAQRRRRRDVVPRRPARRLGRS